MMTVLRGPLAGLSHAVPVDIDDKWLNENYVSKFARSASVAVLSGSPVSASRTTP